MRRALALAAAAATLAAPAAAAAPAKPVWSIVCLQVRVLHKGPQVLATTILRQVPCPAARGSSRAPAA